MRRCLSVARCVQVEREACAEFNEFSETWLKNYEECMAQFWNEHNVQELIFFSIDESWTFYGLVRCGESKTYIPVELDRGSDDVCKIKFMF